MRGLERFLEVEAYSAAKGSLGVLLEFVWREVIRNVF